jgi:hypothetical protein
MVTLREAPVQRRQAETPYVVAASQAAFDSTTVDRSFDRRRPILLFSVIPPFASAAADHGEAWAWGPTALVVTGTSSQAGRTLDGWIAPTAHFHRKGCDGAIRSGSRRSWPGLDLTH